jgi:hypothetical protein
MALVSFFRVRDRDAPKLIASYGNAENDSLLLVLVVRGAPQSFSAMSIRLGLVRRLLRNKEKTRC